MPGNRHYILEGWSAIGRWTFQLTEVPKGQSRGRSHNRHTMPIPTRIRHRHPGTYTEPAEPTLTGELILRGLKENA